MRSNAFHVRKEGWAVVKHALPPTTDASPAGAGAGGTVQAGRRCMPDVSPRQCRFVSPLASRTHPRQPNMLPPRCRRSAVQFTQSADPTQVLLGVLLAVSSCWWILLWVQGHMCPCGPCICSVAGKSIGGAQGGRDAADSAQRRLHPGPHLCAVVVALGVLLFALWCMHLSCGWTAPSF